MKNKYWQLLFGFLAGLLAIWSYQLVDPNLVLFNSHFFYSVQQKFWEVGANRNWLSASYFLIISFWFGAWIWGYRRGLAKNITKSWKKMFIFILPIVIILWLGMNALSHDIFNYLFNAKMLWQFQADPHQQVALDFSYDPWVRFMHNTHTPAPYGYGWTIISLPPFIASSGIFVLAFWGMKLWMIVALLVYLYLIWKLMQLEKADLKNYYLLALHPLLLIETVLNGHNDVWMMWPVLLALWLILRFGVVMWVPVAVLALWLVSINIKLATLVLAPVLGGLYFWSKWGEKLSIRITNFAKWWRSTWPEWSALALLVPLFTARSQRFHPWYLIWSLSFLPFINWKWLRYSLLGLSITALYRYLPWMQANLEYSEVLIFKMQLITWSGALLGLLYYLIEFIKLNLLKNK